jgi:Predicted AAA-ATPase/PD-(D/E)XK nuclease superfamily
MARQHQLQLGVSEFRNLREDELVYVDKSLLIRDVIADAANVLLLPRPRRFGKTTNLSMLRTFFARSPEPLWPLFEGLAIADAGDDVRRHFQRYPTIALTFKDVTARTWTDCRAALARVISRAYEEHVELLMAGVLSDAEAETFRDLQHGRASNAQMWASLGELAMYLQRRYGERVLVLIDEYDTPIHASFVHHYYDDAVEFLRNFLSGGLKDNRSLWKGVLTGVLRVARDSVFTGLNNLEVYSLLRPEYCQYFGFTEDEVAGLLASTGASDRMEDVRGWYNGYVFGGRVMYNPWSVLAYLKSQDRALRPHWADTSSNDLVRELLVGQGLGLRGEMERLMRGEEIERAVAEHVALRDLQTKSELVWSLLLYTGYLKAVGQRRESRTLWCRLAIPNQEVLSIYESLFLAWTDEGLGGDQKRQELIRALLGGDVETCERLLEQWLLASASLHDTARFAPPERFYHGFVLGLLVSLGERYDVVSNQESGYGRCDVLITPRVPGQPGVVLELKVRDDRRGETVEQALERALDQLAARDYAASLRTRGAAPVHELAVVFDGKRVFVRARE